MDEVRPYDAVVLAGGRARRFGDDKVLAEVDGTALLVTAVRAVRSAEHVVVVGPPREVALGREVLWCREDPPFGGPVAGLAAGLDALADHDGDDRDVLLLAADLPLAPDLVAALLAARTGDEAHVVVDEDGRAQWAASLLPRGPLRRALVQVDEVDGASLRRLFSHLQWKATTVPSGTTWDVDTPEDLRRP